MASVPVGDLLKQAEAEGLSPCPKGTYNAKIVKAEAKTTSTGKDMIGIVFEITDGPQMGRKIEDKQVVSPESKVALKIWFKNMAAMGLGQSYMQGSPAYAQIASDLLGRPCRIMVGTRTWNEEEMEDVKKVMPPAGGGVPTPPAPGVAAPATPQPAATPPAPAPAAAAAPSVPAPPEVPF